MEEKVTEWLPSIDLLVAACLAHDLGHPPFGHGGEKALHTRMAKCGGFEGNGQTLRIVTRLEKYKLRMGMNPTRRIVLALLKYPVPYSEFDTVPGLEDRHTNLPGTRLSSWTCRTAPGHRNEYALKIRYVA